MLAEQCFLSSEADAAAFASDEGCKTVARTYYEAICEYFGNNAHHGLTQKKRGRTSVRPRGIFARSEAIHKPGSV